MELPQISDELRTHPKIIAVGVFGISFLFYVMTLAPGLLWGGGDFALFQTRLFTGEIVSGVFGHPLWVVLAHPFLWLPIRDVAYRANLSAAFFASLALAFVFLCAWRLTRSVAPSLLAAGALLISHTFWTYAVMPKPYSLNALLLSMCLYFLLAWAEESRGVFLLIFAALYGISPINHLVMFTAFAGFLVFIILVARRSWKTSFVRVQLIRAALIYLACTSIYLWLVLQGGQAQPVGNTVDRFLAGFLTALTTPSLLLLGIGLGAALWIYQFVATIPVGIYGIMQSWRGDKAIAIMLLLVALGDVAFLLGATDPRTGGDYVWNLHYYLQAYIVFSLWIAIGLNASWSLLAHTRPRQIAAVALSLGLPIALYAIAPIVARPFIANLPGFREIGGRDNLVYVLSPWKQNETGARVFGETILDSMPHNSILFADYSIWAIVNYLQVVEGQRVDIDLVELSSADSGQQLPAILAHSDLPLFLADTGRYYDMAAIQQYYTLEPTGVVYRLVPK
jgi:transmembrane protein TMEM260 (protein O-mannosyltransferase)